MPYKNQTVLDALRAKYGSEKGKSAEVIKMASKTAGKATLQRRQIAYENAVNEAAKRRASIQTGPNPFGYNQTGVSVREAGQREKDYRSGRDLNPLDGLPKRTEEQPLPPGLQNLTEQARMRMESAPIPPPPMPVGPSFDNAAASPYGATGGMPAPESAPAPGRLALPPPPMPVPPPAAPAPAPEAQPPQPVAPQPSPGVVPPVAAPQPPVAGPQQPGRPFLMDPMSSPQFLFNTAAPQRAAFTPPQGGPGVQYDEKLRYEMMRAQQAGDWDTFLRLDDAFRKSRGY